MTGRFALLRTSSFRLALAAVLLFTLTTGALLAITWRVTLNLIDNGIDQTLQAEVDGLEDAYRRLGAPGLIDSVNDRVRDPVNTSLYLYTAPGRGLAAGNLSRWPPDLTIEDGFARFRFTDPDRVDGLDLAARGRVFRLAGGQRLLVARDLADRDAFARRLGQVVSAALGATLLVGLGSGLWLSRRSLARVEAMGGALDRIKAGEFGARLPVGAGGDEIDRLAEAVNDSLSRIETLMRGLKRLSNTLAHELRTPLSRLRTRLERAAGSADGSPDHLEAALEEADRMLAMIRGLLDIAEAEAGLLDHAKVPVDLCALLTDLADLYTPAAEALGHPLLTEIEAGLQVNGHPALLTQAMANLLDNALKYAGDRGPITLGGCRRGQGVDLWVADHGAGIPPERFNELLQPFARGDHDKPGTGLGLALVGAVAGAHGGGVSVSGDPDNGLPSIVTVGIHKATDLSPSFGVRV